MNQQRKEKETDKTDEKDKKKKRSERKETKRMTKKKQERNERQNVGRLPCSVTHAAASATPEPPVAGQLELGIPRVPS